MSSSSPPLSELSVAINSRATNNFSYHPEHIQCFLNPYSNLNPTGGITLAIAENKLSSDLLLTKFKSAESLNLASLCYTDSSGDITFKKCLAQFMSKHIFAGQTISTDHLVINAGCTAILYQLSVLLLNPNDALLIPVPYYPVFDKDWKNLGRVHIEEVMSDTDDSFVFTVTDLENAFQKALSKGHPPKALLLTNPHNPVGTVLSSEMILSIVTWCRSHNLHIIVDEIYALSTFEGRFTSVVEVLHNNLGNDVHVLWGLSKDLGASGMRVGVLYSQSKDLLSSAKNLSDAFQVSVLTQQLAALALNDDEFMISYLQENRCRLRKSYDYLRSELVLVGLKVVPAVSSIFAMVDLRSLLRQQTFDDEKRLYYELAQSGIVLTPGVSCHCPTPGFFRVCYAWVTFDHLQEGIRRLLEVAANNRDDTVKSYKKHKSKM